MVEGMLLLSLEGHDDRVWHCAYSRCGELLATCGADKSIRIYRRSGFHWECIAVLEDTQSRTIRCCEFSPCSSYLAAASFDATTVIWQRGRADEDSHEVEWRCVCTMEGHENEVKSVTWNFDGSLLATCSRDKSIWIWEAPPPRKPTDILPDEDIEVECISVLTGHAQDVKYVAFHPTENILFSCSYDDSIKVWAEGVDDWGIICDLVGHENTVWGLAIDRSTGNQMVSVSQDCTIRLWTRQGPNQEWRPAANNHVLTERHERTIFSVDWSPDGKYIITGSGDDCIKIIETENYQVVKQINNAHSSDINCVRFHPTEPGLFASCGDDGLIKVWKI